MHEDAHGSNGPLVRGTGYLVGQREAATLPPVSGTQAAHAGMAERQTRLAQTQCLVRVRIPLPVPRADIPTRPPALVHRPGKFNSPGRAGCRGTCLRSSAAEWLLCKQRGGGSNPSGGYLDDITKGRWTTRQTSPTGSSRPRGKRLGSTSTRWRT